MKISICGKGGCGKSTMSALIAGGLKKTGYRVLVVDADESNFGLHRLLGLPLPENVMDSFGGKKGFHTKMAEIREKSGDPKQDLFGQKWTFSSIPEEYAIQEDGLKLLLVGKIHGFAEGCACPMGMLAKTILANLETQEQEAVIVDTEAGTEHFGRGLEGECDMVLAVVDPTYESFLLAKKMEEMGQKANRPVWFVLNKVSDEVEEVMSKELDWGRIIGKVPANNVIFTSSLKGAKLDVDLPEIDRICEFLKESAEKLRLEKGPAL